jgi:hypothetical protein
VRNEQDILAENGEAHLAVVVDAILVLTIDHGSDDATPGDSPGLRAPRL